MSRHISLPYHFYVNVNNSALGPNMPSGTTEGIFHGIYSREHQTLLCHVLLETGAHWSGLPIHQLSLSNDFTYDYGLLMPWASMGENIDTVLLGYLEGLVVRTIKPISESGRHTGIIIDWKDGFSRYPQEHKPLNLISLDKGQFALLPNNFFLIEDKHFTSSDSQSNLKFYRRGEKVFWEK